MTEQKKINIPVMADLHTQGKKPEYLFWVGCAGAYDDRYKKVTRAFAKILTYFEVNYAVLGTEETCTGDPARRAGNEMLFQMQAMQVIETFSRYDIKKIITICPHCFNTFKNEYPDFGGQYEVIHHTKFIQQLLDAHPGEVNQDILKKYKVTYHDPCYLGRANGEYDAPRDVINKVVSKTLEIDPHKSKALCCGAGGAQMFKEAEPGDREVYDKRTEQALATGADVVATACPFCMTMITDGLKLQKKEDTVKNYDIAELVAMALGI
ncbi:MAG TPA: (Fe-S)-binding protein [Salinivirga sp.]|uniref:(Fe-S)-binding protein n=1 Tax=Salinivirga sp. TaxID=1970192 RepID=UPI002B4A318A|nr:(Fe-S)-binding protein [Salinivirga sp.]HKK60503.1 (Fe-S)-binding protein [Salinivirga sp.]